MAVGRWEAHLWVKELGRQVYLGGYENEEHAAEAYDVAALKCKGPRVRTNFPLSRYVPPTSPAPAEGGMWQVLRSPHTVRTHTVRKMEWKSMQ